MSATCPFCGKQHTAIDTLNYTSGKPEKFRVKCQNCGVCTRWCDTEEQARDAWNVREKTEGPQKYPGSLQNMLICKDLFVFKHLVHARNPQNEYCYISGINGYKRMKKADYLKAYAECAKAEGKVKP
jgi:Lar family restriction alleviation protein